MIGKIVRVKQLYLGIGWIAFPRSRTGLRRRSVCQKDEEKNKTKKMGNIPN